MSGWIRCCPKRLHSFPLYSYFGRSFPGKIVSYLRSQVRLTRDVQVRRPDLFHFQWSRIPLIDILVLLLLRRRLSDTVFMTIVHNVLPHEAGVGARFIWKHFYRRFDALVVHEENAAENLRSLIGGDSRRIGIIPHGPLSFDGERDSLFESAPLSGSQHAGDNLPVISFLGYLRNYKGLDLVLECLKDPGIREKGRFLIAGDGRCTELAELAGLPEVTVINRHLENHEFVACIRRSDLVLLPYRRISQSGILLTCVTEGVPVLASNVGGLPDLVELHRAGWTFPGPTFPELHKALSKLLDDPDALRTRRKPAWTREKVESEWRTIAEKTLSMLHDANRADS
jgi:D-inositol-3-phosphate glycosyltransferase